MIKIKTAELISSSINNISSISHFKKGRDVVIFEFDPFNEEIIEASEKEKELLNTLNSEDKIFRLFNHSTWSYTNNSINIFCKNLLKKYKDYEELNFNFEIHESELSKNIMSNYLCSKEIYLIVILKHDNDLLSFKNVFFEIPANNILDK